MSATVQRRLPRRTALALLAAVSLRPGMGCAQSPAETPSAFIQRIGHELPEVVAGAATPAERSRRLQPFLARVVDVDSVARFCLGRYWLQATPAQQAEYTALFLRVLANAVATRVSVYDTGTSKITVLPEAVRPDGAYVTTVVQPEDSAPVRVTWVVNTAVNPFRITDVQAEGMSLRLAQRSDYTSFLQNNNGDIAVFLRTLRDRTP